MLLKYTKRGEVEIWLREMGKSGAQLQREIDAWLRERSKPKKFRLHHVDVEPTEDDEWGVAIDAIMEHDAKRAAEIVRNIYNHQGATFSSRRYRPSYPFTWAYADVPVSVQKDFDRHIHDLGTHSPIAYNYTVYPNANHRNAERSVKVPVRRGKGPYDITDAKKVAKKMGSPAAIYGISEGRFIGHIRPNGRYAPFGSR